MRLLATDLARVLGAPLIGVDTEVHGIAFDSRNIASGEMFAAIVAERDGHDYVGDAIAHGATAVLVSRQLDNVGVTQLVVDDTVAALAVLAAWRREHLDAQLDNRVVAITGSVGKTSTKDMVVAALSGAPMVQPVVASSKSLNNDIGLPVTIFNAGDDVRTLVLEMGMRGFGEIERLCSVAKPNIGVVTTVGDAHSERVGGIDGVARAKSELVRALPDDGIAVLNFDDPRVRAMADATSADVVSYGLVTDADVSYEISSVDDLCATIMVEHRGLRERLRVNWPGVHMASNAAAACAAAIACGVDLPTAIDGLSRLRPNTGRITVATNSNGLQILDDSYNANPTSMSAALEMLATCGAQTKIAVLGVMAEVDDPVRAHLGVSRLASRLGIRVIAVDEPLYGSETMSLDDAVATLKGLGDGVAVLIKGSRVARLERIVDQITE